MASGGSSHDDAIQALSKQISELSKSIQAQQDRETARDKEIDELSRAVVSLNATTSTVRDQQTSKPHRISRKRDQSSSESSDDDDHAAVSPPPSTLPLAQPAFYAPTHPPYPSAPVTLQPPLPSGSPTPQGVSAHFTPDLLEPGLFPTPVADEAIRHLLDYRTYRLRRRQDYVSSRSSGRIAEYANRVRSQTQVRFSGNPPIRVLYFLRTLRIAFDDTGLTEGLALRLVSHFLDEPVATTFSRCLRIHGGTVSTYPQAIAWFLTAHASEAAVSAKQREVALLSRQTGESIQEYGTRLQFEAALLGDLINDRALRTHFYAGLDEATSTFLRSILPYGVATQTFHEAVAHATMADQSVRALRPPAHSFSRQQQTARPPTALGRRILAVPEGRSEVEQDSPETGEFDADQGVFAVREIGQRDIRQYYCFVCWKHGHFALDCPLIPEEERKLIAARKAGVLGMLKNKPGWLNRNGRMIPNVPYPNIPREDPDQSKNE
jgi:hypothetical protein